MKQFCYAILVENTPDKYLRQESTFLPSEYKNTKYALIQKQHFNDGSEGINFIKYSDDLTELFGQLVQHVSWYDYVRGFTKNIQGNVSKLFS